GGGGIPSSLSVFGLYPSTVRARSAGVLDVVLKLWASDGRFTYRGKFFDIDTPVLDPVKGRGYYMKPYQEPHPPIAVAASTPDSSSMRMAGERGWIPMSSSLLSRSHLAAHWRLVETGAAGAGRQADRSQWRIARDVLVAPTSALARERARPVPGRNHVQPQYPHRLGTWQCAPKGDSAMTYRYDHMHLRSRDVKKTAEYYHRVFGARIVESIQSDGKPRTDLDLDGLTIFIAPVAPEAATPSAPSEPYV